MHENSIDSRQFAETLIELDVCDDATGQDQVPESCLAEVVCDVVRGNKFEDVLIRRRDVDLGKLRRQHAREVHVIALEDLEVAVFDRESGEEHIAKYGGIGIGGE